MDQHNTVCLIRGNNTSCGVFLPVGTIVSWYICGEQQLFVSRNSILNGTNPISGGIPLAFPFIGYWPLGFDDGFAKILQWEIIDKPYLLDNGNVEASFGFKNNHFTESMWAASFSTKITIILGETDLTVKFNLTHSGKQSPLRTTFTFLAYLQVSDIHKVKIEGLQNSKYLDCITQKKNVDEKETLEIHDRIHRAYPNFNKDVCIIDKRRMKILRQNLPDLVIINPWDHIGSEFEKDDYGKFICVGIGFATEAAVIPNGNTLKSVFVLSA